jgi:hydroxymethylglutaryl-CoA synthase
MIGVVGYGAYVPYWRVDRTGITSAIGGRRSPGWRTAASYDEDTTTMGVEAARNALRSVDDLGNRPVFFATSEPAYLDKSNANAIHAALDLDRATPAFDLVGNARSSVPAVMAAAELGGIVVASDMRNGPAGSVDESSGGDGAAALLFGDYRVIAELVGTGHATHEFMERWRLPAEKTSHSTDERSVEFFYSKLIDGAMADALKAADISDADVQQLIISAANPRVGRTVVRSLGGRKDILAGDLSDEIGYCGTAHWPLVLTDVLDRAEPDQHIVVVAMADGVTAMVFHTTNQLDAYRAERTRRQIPSLADQLESRASLPYGRFANWRGTLLTEAPRLADPQPYSAVAAERNTRWKYGLVASRDDHGYLHLPPARVSSEGGAIDDMVPIRMADVEATVAAVTVDHASYSPASAVVDAVIDFDGGGRATVEVTDVEAEDIRVGDRVEMTFRRLSTTVDGHNYFWKARLSRRPRRH